MQTTIADWIIRLTTINCFLMRVKVDEFRPKCERIWVYTCVENPELAKQQFHRTEIFKYMTQDLNTFNGKYNAFHESVDILYHWLYEYVMACLPDGMQHCLYSL